MVVRNICFPNSATLLIVGQNIVSIINTANNYLNQVHHPQHKSMKNAQLNIELCNSTQIEWLQIVGGEAGR